jgi:hypothetical protein
MHFLQPNQYVRDSKQLAEEEKIFFEKKAYKDLVSIGYPMLINAADI